MKLASRVSPPRLFRAFAAVSVSAALVAMSVAPAFADTPTVEKFSDQSSGIAPGLSAACGFTVMHDTTLQGTNISYPDGSGQLSEQVLTYWTANGKTIIERDAFSISTATDGTLTLSGANYMAYQEGSGLVVVDAGRLIFGSDGDLVGESGPHPIEAVGRAQYYCPVLGG